MRRYGFALRLAGSFSLVYIAVAVVGLEHCGRIIWVANGIGLSYLLLAPRWRWKYYLAATFIGIFAARLLVNPETFFQCFAHAIFNAGETALAALALRKRSAALPHF